MYGPRLDLFWSCAASSLALFAGAGSALANRFYFFDFEPAMGPWLLISGVLAFLGGAGLLTLAVSVCRRPEAFQALNRSISRVASLAVTLLAWISVLAFLPIPAAHRRMGGLALLGVLAIVAGLPLVFAPRRVAPLAVRALDSKTARAGGLVAWCTVAVLGATEILVRTFEPLLTPQGGFVADVKTARTLLGPGHPIPGSLGRANSLAYNDTEWSIQKAPGTLRIAALGDSFSYGVVGYDVNVLTLLEATFRASDRSVEVLNFGIPAAQPADYLDTLRADALRFEPDLVLICFFVGNDFAFSTRERFVAAGHVVTADRTINPFQKLVDKNRWYLYHHIRLLVLAQTALQNGSELEPARTATFTERAYAQIQAERLPFFLRPGNGLLDAGMKHAATHLDGIVEQSKKIGADVVLAVFPDEFQVDTEQRERSMNASRMAWEDLDLDRPQRLLAAWGSSRGVPVIDLLPALRSAAARHRVYFLRDTHWNEAGNRLAAEVLARELARHLPAEASSSAR